MSTSEATATPATESSPPPPAASAVSERVKNSLVVVRRRIDAAEGQLRAVPAQIRENLDKLLRAARDRVRAGLHLPSQAEIEALMARVEELDRKLGMLAAAQAAAADDDKPADKPKKKNGR
ncbi:MAG TPA: hypothetical protein VL172_01900 [Kofleriaceae bacterium]|jgi:hypothetical protein|nr:hypothetical protein [Kofleriaceae bacterium]